MVHSEKAIGCMMILFGCLFGCMGILPTYAAVICAVGGIVWIEEMTE